MGTCSHQLKKTCNETHAKNVWNKTLAYKSKHIWGGKRLPGIKYLRKKETDSILDSSFSKMYFIYLKSTKVSNVCNVSCIRLIKKMVILQIANFALYPNLINLFINNSFKKIYVHFSQPTSILSIQRTSRDFHSQSYTMQVFITKKQVNQAFLVHD